MPEGLYFNATVTDNFALEAEIMKYIVKATTLRTNENMGR